MATGPQSICSAECTKSLEHEAWYPLLPVKVDWGMLPNFPFLTIKIAVGQPPVTQRLLQRKWGEQCAGCHDRGHDASSTPLSVRLWLCTETMCGSRS